MRAKLTLLIVLLYIAACAPLRPLSPERPVQRIPQSPSGPSRPIDPAQIQNITGLDSWDKVLSPWLGTPYLLGGTTKNGVDCSGFVSSVYMEKESMSIPRTSAEEFKIGRAVAKHDLKIGDLVFFGDNLKVSHVGIYVGDGKFIHASTSLGVTVTPLSDSYWVPRYIGARRYLL
ncbi:MAG: NlpC/P60 family protein [Fibromonadales bacterium]|nr:NlpC/P60 family protein [Fibromonadales bacterium]